MANGKWKMENRTLYLKYRPQKIEELDLTEIREQLGKIVKSGKIPHAFLFAGPRGSGKTSAARILAKIVNCEKGGKEPCNKCAQCKAITGGSSLDIIEIDAASHRGVDDVRSLREAVKLSPAGAKMKVYIIDEAHMLTTEAANALLKTLEEPPEHVMFILATTAPEKLPDTIRSRCTTLTFGKANKEEIIRSLRRVVKGEKLKVEKGVLEEIAGGVDGSFREAHKILEQLSLGSKKITVGEAKKLVALTTVDPGKLLKLLARNKLKESIEEIDRVAGGGANLKNYTTEIIGRLRRMLLLRLGVEEEAEDITEFTNEDIRALIELFSQASLSLPTAVIAQLPLELAVVHWCEKEVKSGKWKVVSEEVEKQIEGKETPEPPVTPHPSPVTSSLEDQWREVMRRVKTKNHSIEALLRATRPLDFDGKTLKIEVFYEFHKERLERETYRNILEEVAGEVLDSKVRIVCLLSQSRKRAADLAGVDEQEEEDIVKAAEEIFGEGREEDAN